MEYPDPVMASSPEPQAPQVPQALQARRLSIQFTGSGSEYFRIWIVNLLLTIVTFTLYRPFARARRIIYFQNNTVIDGASLGFHGDPWKMFKGYLLLIGMGLLYSFSYLVPGLLFVVLVAFAFVAPALWRAALQFRLGNTSWRGVRFQFQGDLAGAYSALLLPMVPFLLVAAAVTFAALTRNGPLAGTFVKYQFIAIWIGSFLMVATVLALPWLFARIKRYQHGGYAYTQERAQLRVPGTRFYVLVFGLIGLVIVAWLLWILSTFVFGFALGRMGVLLVGVLGYVLFLTSIQTYFVVKLQNVLWSNTRSRHIEFRSRLRFLPFWRLTAVNWLLIACTFGLFWPFAQVRATRARLEAVEVGLHGESEGWLTQAQAQSKGSLGDATGDFFGLDIGL